MKKVICDTCSKQPFLLLFIPVLMKTGQVLHRLFPASSVLPWILLTVKRQQVPSFPSEEKAFPLIKALTPLCWNMLLSQGNLYALRTLHHGRNCYPVIPRYMILLFILEVLEFPFSTVTIYSSFSHNVVRNLNLKVKNTFPFLSSSGKNNTF